MSTHTSPSCRAMSSSSSSTALCSTPPSAITRTSMTRHLPAPTLRSSAAGYAAGRRASVICPGPDGEDHAVRLELLLRLVFLLVAAEDALATLPDRVGRLVGVLVEAT